MLKDIIASVADEVDASITSQEQEDINYYMTSMDFNRSDMNIPQNRARLANIIVGVVNNREGA